MERLGESAVALREWDFADNGRAHRRREVVDVVDACIQRFTNERGDDGEHEREDQPEREVEFRARRGGVMGDRGRGRDRDISALKVRVALDGLIRVLRRREFGLGSLYASLEARPRST